MSNIKWKPLLTSILLTLGAGALSGILTAGSMQQYAYMYKPPFAPPGWVFPVVWTVLYILMGTAAYLVYMSGSPDKYRALRLYVVQLIVNILWPVVFFNYRAYLTGFVWILLLLYFVLLTTEKFYAIAPAAGWLMIPYLIWIIFAAYLNLAIVFHYVLR